jgi:hypothetical protein
MQNWNKSRLQDYLLYDRWKTFSGLQILAGFDGELTCSTRSERAELDSEYLLDLASKHLLGYARGITSDDEYIDKNQIQKMLNNIDRLESFWRSSNWEGMPKSPASFIDWALSKRFRPNWLDWAINEGLYKEKDKEKTEKPLSKRTENNYLRLIMALANGIKDFNPKIGTYAAAQLIIDETEIDLSKDTIANYILKAYELEAKERD